MAHSLTQQDHALDRIELGGIVAVRDRLLALQAAGQKVLRLESGDPSFSIAPHVAEAMAKAIRDGHTHYTPGAGIPALRRAAWNKMCRENRLPLSDPERVLITNGAMHGLYLIYRALIAPGDEVIVPDPTWTETADNVTIAGGVAVRCPLEPDSWRYAPERIAEKITPRTRAIIINSPHNPTGAVLDQPTLQGILELALRHGLYIVSDEAYEHVIYDDLPHLSIGALPGAERCVISVYSMSKSYAMSGLRIGYLACNDDRLLERMTKLLRCTINGVNSVAQHGAVAALEGPTDHTREMNRVYRQRRDLLMTGLAGHRLLTPFRPAGAFYVWCRIAGDWPGYQDRHDGWSLTNYLVDKAGVGSAPGEVFGPGGMGYLRLSFSCATDHIERAVAALGQLKS